MLYRGFKDTLPSKINYDQTYEGLFGNGVYFSRDISVAEWYGFKSCDVFGIVVGFNCGVKKLLKFKDGVHFKNNHPADNHFNLLPKGRAVYSTKEKTAPIDQLLRCALESGYEGLLIEMDVFCEQIVVLPSYSGLTLDSWLFYNLETTFDNPSEEEMLAEIDKIKLAIGA